MLLELGEANPYTARAYHRAADGIRSTPAPIAELVRSGRVRERTQDVRTDGDRFSVRQTRVARSDATVSFRRRYDQTRQLRNDYVQRTPLEV